MFLTNKFNIPPESEMAIQLASGHAQTETTAAIIEPLIATLYDIESSAVPGAFQNTIVARTVCHWSATNNTAVVQIADPSNQYVLEAGYSIINRAHCTSISSPEPHDQRSSNCQEDNGIPTKRTSYRTD